MSSLGPTLDEDHLVTGFLNPLAFFAVEEPWTQLPDHHPVTEDDLRQFLVEPHLDNSLDAIVRRYLEISQEGNGRIFMAPNGVLQQLIWPLRYAKGSYALGNYLGTLALCGTVCEMCTVFMFECYNLYWGPQNKNKKVKPQYAKWFVEGHFVKERQVDRVKFLTTLGLVTPEIKLLLDQVRRARSKHLHVEPGSESVAKDAVTTYLNTVRVVNHALGLGIKDGKVTLRPEVHAWIDAHTDA
jgi:hypothetical protein